MSTDRTILEALASKTKEELRYFEAVSFKFDTNTKFRRCYLCLGKHSVIFMRMDMSGPIRAGGPDPEQAKEGELMYAHIDKAWRDTNSEMWVVLQVNQNSGWPAKVVALKSENRDLLLKHLRCGWQTDYMWRTNTVASFPLFTRAFHEQSKDHADTPIQPFKEHRWQVFRGYKFMLPHGMEEVGTVTQAANTGEYKDAETNVQVTIQVHSILTMEELILLNREYIRWVAYDYKLNLVQDEKHFYILRNSPRPKRMNLTGDTAAWWAWELIIRSESATLICLLLRRQHIPPLCDNAQDLAVIMRVPTEEWNRSELQLVLEAQLIADTMSPVFTTSIYAELVQAKLDGLRFHDEGHEWILSHLKLHTNMRREALKFVRKLLTMFSQTKFTKEFPHDFKLLLDDKSYLTNEEREWKGLDPELQDIDRAYFDALKEKGDGLVGTDEEVRIMKNEWLARVARYFAWAVDGGVLGPRFTLDIMIDEVLPSILGEAEVQTRLALEFMLHFRTKENPRSGTGPFCDWIPTWKSGAGNDDDLPTNQDANKGAKPGEGQSFEVKKQDALPRLVQDLKNMERGTMFNDRVMLRLIGGPGGGYLSKEIGRQRPEEYFKCLAHMLRSGAGINLKAYICRIFCEMKMKMEQGGGKAQMDDTACFEAVPALMSLVEEGHTYLATYATAALVNISHANDTVKMQLMQQGIPKLLVKNIQSKDDDLIHLTLQLMVNMTKEAHHRFIFANAGVLPLLYDILTSTYHQCGADNDQTIAHDTTKQKILKNVCSLVGHFCRGEEHRDHLVNTYEFTVRCMVYIAENSAYGSELLSKVFFALKQICANNADQKRIVGDHLVKPLMKYLNALREMKFLDGPPRTLSEFVARTIELLHILCTYKDNCLKIDAMMDLSWRDVFEFLVTPPANLHAVLKPHEEAIRNLGMRIKADVDQGELL